jgi:hypothetical protein
VIDVDTSSSEEEIDDQKAIAMMKSRNPFIKLMIIGRMQTKIKDLFKKSKLNKVDIKLLKGIFLKNTEHKAPKKGLFETFSPHNPDSHLKSRIIRRFRSFVIEETVEDEVARRYSTQV